MQNNDSKQPKRLLGKVNKDVIATVLLLIIVCIANVSVSQSASDDAKKNKSANKCLDHHRKAGAFKYTDGLQIQSKEFETKDNNI